MRSFTPAMLISVGFPLNEIFMDLIKFSNNFHALLPCFFPGTFNRVEITRVTSCCNHCVGGGGHSLTCLTVLFVKAIGARAVQVNHRECSLGGFFHVYILAPLGRRHKGENRT